MEGDSDDELEELNELHIRVLISIDRFIDYSHLSQVKLDLYHARSDETADTFEDFLGWFDCEAYILRVPGEDFHDAF